MCLVSYIRLICTGKIWINLCKEPFVSVVLLKSLSQKVLSEWEGKPFLITTTILFYWSCPENKKSLFKFDSHSWSVHGNVINMYKIHKYRLKVLDNGNILVLIHTGSTTINYTFPKIFTMKAVRGGEHDCAHCLAIWSVHYINLLNTSMVR